jgi:hypothetical protein
MDLLAKGQSTSEVLEIIHAEFPHTRANATDVGKARARMMQQREKVT